jgi:hypothetical protein
MPTELIQCPSCDATLKMASPSPPGARVKCPKCATIFKAPASATEAPDEDERPPTRSRPAAPKRDHSRDEQPWDVIDDDEADRPAGRRRERDDHDDRPARRRPERYEDEEDDRPARRRPARDYEDDDDRPARRRGHRDDDYDDEPDDYEARPARRSRRGRAKKKSSAVLILVIGLAVAGVGLLGGLGYLAYYLYDKNRTYTVNIKQFPDVNKTVTIRQKLTSTGTIRERNAGREVIKEEKMAEVKETVCTQKIQEFAGKLPSKFQESYTKAYTTTNGKTVTHAYQGRTVAFEGTGGKYRATAQGQPNLSDQDLGDLAHREIHSTDNAFAPSQAVKLGESYVVSGQKLRSALGDSSVAQVIDGHCDSKLVKVYKKDGRQFGTIEFKLNVTLNIGKDLQSATMLMDATGTLDTPIDGSSTDQFLTMSGTMTMALPGNQGMVEVNASFTLELERSAEQ